MIMFCILTCSNKHNESNFKSAKFLTCLLERVFCCYLKCEQKSEESGRSNMSNNKITSLVFQENTLKKRLRSKKMKKKPVKVKEGVKDVEKAPEEEEEGEENEGGQESSGSRDKASSALIPPKKGKLKRKKKVKEEMLDAPESLESNETPTKGCP